MCFFFTKREGMDLPHSTWESSRSLGCKDLGPTPVGLLEGKHGEKAKFLDEKDVFLLHSGSLQLHSQMMNL